MPLDCYLMILGSMSYYSTIYDLTNLKYLAAVYVLLNKVFHSTEYTLIYRYVV